MTRDPAIMSITEENGVRDTLYLGGDLLLLRGIPRCDIPEEWKKDAEKRIQDLSGHWTRGSRQEHPAEDALF